MPMKATPHAHGAPCLKQHAIPGHDTATRAEPLLTVQIQETVPPTRRYVHERSGDCGVLNTDAVSALTQVHMEDITPEVGVMSEVQGGIEVGGVVEEFRRRVRGLAFFFFFKQKTAYEM